MQAPRRCPPSSILVWLYVDLHKSQYPLGFLNPKDLISPGPVAVAHTGAGSGTGYGVMDRELGTLRYHSLPWNTLAISPPPPGRPSLGDRPPPPTGDRRAPTWEVARGVQGSSPDLRVMSATTLSCGTIVALGLTALIPDSENNLEYRLQGQPTKNIIFYNVLFCTVLWCTATKPIRSFANTGPDSLCPFVPASLCATHTAVTI